MVFILVHAPNNEKVFLMIVVGGDLTMWKALLFIIGLFFFPKENY